MNKDGAMTHLKLLRLLYDLEVSRSTMFRIIEPINSMTSPEEIISREKELISLLERCKSETEVLQAMDEADL